MCAYNLPRVALDSGEAEIQTRDLLIASLAPYRYATEPHAIGNVIFWGLLSPDGHVLECRTCNCEVTGSTLIRGYCQRER